MKKYVICEEELLGLLRDSYELQALHSGGVDNWTWYGYSRMDYLEACDAEDFDELAQNDLEAYEEV
jgi:hypothetical protein